MTILQLRLGKHPRILRNHCPDENMYITGRHQLAPRWRLTCDASPARTYSYSDWTQNIYIYIHAYKVHIQIIHHTTCTVFYLLTVLAGFVNFSPPWLYFTVLGVRLRRYRTRFQYVRTSSRYCRNFKAVHRLSPTKPKLISLADRFRAATICNSNNSRIIAIFILGIIIEFFDSHM